MITILPSSQTGHFLLADIGKPFSLVGLRSLKGSKFYDLKLEIEPKGILETR